MSYTLRHRDQRANYLDLSDSYSSDSDNSRVKPPRPTRRRSKDRLETEMVYSRVDLSARDGQGCRQGGKTRSFSQKAIETEMVDSSVDLNARHGQGRGQVGNTKLCTPRAMGAKMDSSVNLVARNTTVCTPTEVGTKMVNSDVDLIARSGQSGNTTLCPPRAMETEMVDLNVDKIVGNTTLCTPRAMESEMVDSSADLIARRGRGGNKTLGTPKATETKMVDSSVDLIARHGWGDAQGRKRTLCSPRALETEIVDSNGDLIAENAKLCTPRAMETELADSSVDLIARQRRVRGKGDNTTCISREMEGSSVDLISKRKQVHWEGQNRTLCTPRATENEMVDSSVDLIARSRRIHGKGGNTTLCTSRAMETEMVDSSVDLISRRRWVHGRDGKTALSAPRAMETEIVDSNVDLIAENPKLCAQKAKDAEMVESSLDLIARCGNNCGRGQDSTSSSARVMETGLVRSVVLALGNTTSCTPRALETEMVPSSVDSIGRSVRGRGRGGRGRRRGGGRGGAGTRWGVRGARSRPSQKREAAKGEQNKETDNPKPSSIIESSPEGQATSMKRRSPSPERVRSCKKTILSWLIDCKLIEEDEQVCYMDGTKKSATLTGRITRGGILCNCCQKETSVWTFERHAGSDLRQPYEHIYLLRKGKCLQECQIAAWQNARERKRQCMFPYVPKVNAADQNDDACSICGDGGDLICCDQCLSTYHPSCMNMERVPHYDWLCQYCTCKFCEVGGESKEFITCSQCDKKFHWGCLKEFEEEFAKDTLDVSCSRLYCGPGCREIYEKLEGSLGIRTDIFASYSWRVIRPMGIPPKVVSAARNLHIENNSKVAVAWMLMNEVFDTITDRHTGINVVQSIVYSRGSNITRIDFSRFYTFVLEKDDEIIAAASIRFHGREMAEMPFIATEEAYRGQGMCRSLMEVIEKFLCSLKVKNLIIPSAPETSGMWKCKYKFNEISKELKRKIASYNILMFPRALRLYKDVSKSKAGEDVGEDMSKSMAGEDVGEDMSKSMAGEDVGEDMSKSIADGGNDNEDNQTDIQNGQESQTEQAERPLLDLNVDPHQED